MPDSDQRKAREQPRAGQDGFVPVRDQQGKLLFKYDAQRELVQIVRRGVAVTVDLRQFRVHTEN